MEVMTQGPSMMVWQLMVALGLIGAAILFILSTRSILRTNTFGNAQKIVLFLLTIAIPVVAPAIMIRVINKRDNSA
ncbi:hypothetical protein [Marinoscillum sp.]|uniref:hypothetical protein n=1 Tax=Marinoscillum sp. TaxID=2024838 RepID=UPI003BAB675E